MNRYSLHLVVLMALACFPATTDLAFAQGSPATAERLSLDDATRLTWRTETRAAGIAALRLLASEAPAEAGVRFELARVLTWDVRTRPEGIALLREVTQQAPERIEATETLAEVLAWDLGTRDEGIRRLRRLVEREPMRTSARLKLAEVLSWRAETRDESRALYLGVLREDERSADAAIGLARVLSWSGRLAESREWYQLVLTRNPSDPSARVGIAELEGISGRARASLKTLSATPEGILETPDALRLRAQAYSQIGRPARALDQYARLLALDPSNGTAVQAARLLRRGLRPTIELATEGSRESGDFATNRVETASVPVRFSFHPGGGDAEVSLTGALASYRNLGGSSRDRYAGAGVDAPIGNRVRVSGDLVTHEFDRAKRTLTGRSQFQLAVHDRFDVRFGAAREQLSSSRLSLGGEQASGTFYGPSFVNQVTAAVAVRPGRGWDAWAQATQGQIRGVNISDNGRQELFAGVGKSFYPGGMTLRPGYALSWMSYDLDLGGFPSTDAHGDGVTAPGVGGYFSPRRFLNQVARLDATLPLASSFQIVGGAGVGRQQVEQSNSRDFSHRTGSSDAYLGLRVRAGDRTSIGAQVTYQDVASAFNRTVLRVTLTYGF